MKRPLFAHQVEALKYCRSTPHPALFMEMRLGKTLVAIRALLERGVKRVLVVAPLTVLASWQEELQKEGECFEHVQDGHPKLTQRWSLIGYERLLRMPALGTLPWDAVVLDESSRIKNPKAKTTKLLTRSFRGASARFLLTGLPSPEGPLDYFSQFQFQQGHFLGARNFWVFRKEYFFLAGYDWFPKTGTRARIKEAVREQAFVLSRKEAGLGERTFFEKRVLEPTPEQLRAFKAIRRDFEFSPEKQTKFAMVCSTWLSQVAGGFGPKGEVLSERKLEELETLLLGELKREPVVVFFRFNRELHAAQRRLNAAGISNRRIEGATPLPERQKKRLDFQAGKVRVLLLQLKCCKMGLDFSRASTVIYFSNSFSLEERRQSEDRIVHPLKKEPLLYLDLVTRDSIDEDLFEALREKRQESEFFLRDLLRKIRERRLGD